MELKAKIERLAREYTNSADLEALTSFFFEQQVIYLTDNLNESEITAELSDALGYDIDDPDA
jgi:hypothetical protein